MARPFIWIEAEVQERRAEGQPFSQRTVWESDIVEEEPPAKRLPSDDDTRQILQGIITHVLTSKDVEDSRRFYGTEKDKTVALVDRESFGWPTEFNPITHGYKLIKPKCDPFVHRRRVLGIRIDKFDLKQKKSEPIEASIQICLFNAGGSANGPVIGGCLVDYSAKREGKKWVVECEGSLDP